nr:recombinase family protein [Hyphomonas sp. BRH_c22]
MSLIGYARVSTQDQTLEAQKEALLKAGADLLFTEKVSGAKRDRPELNAMLANLQPGDIVLVTRLDRKRYVDLTAFRLVGSTFCIFFPTHRDTDHFGRPFRFAA